MRILLVEDDELLGEGIRDALVRGHYTVEWVRDGLQGLAAIRAGGFDIVVLDLGLPRLDGVEVIRRAREGGDATPVLVLSARDTPEQRIAGLDAGADDYLIKPFDIGELFARLRALGRRQRGAASNLMVHGPVSIDPVALSVTLAGQPVVLQRREFMLLSKLVESTGQVLSRRQLEETLYGWEGDVESNALDVHIHNLRKKLYPELIRTIRGVGYTVDPPDQADLPQA
ncbi:MAG TPA: response regulator transcription factor [Rhodocyclaceae bacterium]|nr:response regulator transcription factor [Rhodocyclaceae bacterium]HMV53812.1 response regulator transcription factor [Rhodocyclaceae bacterium]HMZ84435.1 response regulator transcription factor [Rhodocyclaceae bacterium]HNA04074.1 response regulator transcription factor [Rhodocyclaceae bacterium]HNB79230.1 response regulator transcription factor [Rhodocyclaceae bacterium]